LLSPFRAEPLWKSEPRATLVPRFALGWLVKGLRPVPKRKGPGAVGQGGSRLIKVDPFGFAQGLLLKPQRHRGHRGEEKRRIDHG